ncbi:MAG TPA: hypothetical protein VGC04_07400 [Cellulomonas sp.]
MTGSRPLRRPATVVALALAPALASALVLAGCSATNPIQTDRPYAASDGVRVLLGDVRAENLLAVTTAAGAPGALSGALVNSGSADADVTLTVGDSSTEVTVPAGSSVLIGTGSGTGKNVPLPTVAAAPGALLDVTLATPAAGTVHVQVPVLDAADPQYTAVAGG